MNHTALPIPGEGERVPAGARAHRRRALLRLQRRRPRRQRQGRPEGGFRQGPQRPQRQGGWICDGVSQVGELKNTTWISFGLGQGRPPRDGKRREARAEGGPELQAQAEARRPRQVHGLHQLQGGLLLRPRGQLLHQALFMCFVNLRFMIDL